MPRFLDFWPSLCEKKSLDAAIARCRMGFGPRYVAGLLEGQKCTSPTERCPQMLSAAVLHEAAPVRRLAQVISTAPCCGLPCRSHVDAAPEALAQHLPPLSSRGRPRPQGRHSKRAGGDPRGSPGPAADAGRAPHPPVLPAFGTPEGAHRPSLKGFRQLQLLLDLIAPFFGHPIISRHIHPSPAHPADIPRRCRSACSTHLREGVCLPTRPLGTFVLKGARRPSHASTLNDLWFHS